MNQVEKWLTANLISNLIESIERIIGWDQDEKKLSRPEKI